MSKAKITMVRIGQIEVGTEIGAGGVRWTLTEVAVTCQKTGFRKIVKSAEEALAVASAYAANGGGHVYRATLPAGYAAALASLPRS